jgi:hypothetical protein
MNNDYLTFAIHEIKKSLDENLENIYVGWDDNGTFLFPMKSWEDYLETLKEFAIEEECFEQVKEIMELQDLVKKHIENKKSQLI